MLNTLYTEDAPLRVNSPLGKAADDMANFYTSAQSMMYNPSVNSVFTLLLGGQHTVWEYIIRKLADHRQAGAGGEFGITVRAGDGRRMGHACQHLWTERQCDEGAEHLHAGQSVR